MCLTNSKFDKLSPDHRHLSNIYCLTAHTACLVCFISTVNGRSKKKSPRNTGASSRHITNLKQSILTFSIFGPNAIFTTFAGLPDDFPLLHCRRVDPEIREILPPRKNQRRNRKFSGKGLRRTKEGKALWKVAGVCERVFKLKKLRISWCHFKNLRLIFFINEVKWYQMILKLAPRHSA